MDAELKRDLESGILKTDYFDLDEATVVDKIKLNQNQDRRVKLTQEQKEQIRDLYNDGGHSLNSLAKQFGVSKKTILLIVNPESKAKNDEYIKNHWKDYYDKDEHTQAMRNTRNYKRDLLDKGEIGNQVILEAKPLPNIKVGNEITSSQAKTFYDKGYIDIVVKNDKGDTRVLPAWHSNEEQKELSRTMVKNKKTGKDEIKITGNKIDLPKFDKVINDIKKELGNNIKFYTQSPESNKTYYNEIEDDNEERVTGKAYKLFKLIKGKLYPPMVNNPGNNDTPIGVWIKCGVDEFDEISGGWGKPQVKGKKLSFRPGWHLGELPYAPQFESKKKNPGYLSDKNFVWAECEYDATIDYQDRAMSYGFTKDGKFGNSGAGLPYRPDRGSYKYRTNPDPNTIAWVITGAMKVNRVLGDDEVERICKENGVPYLRRPGGDKTLKELGLNESLNEVELPILRETLTQDEKDKLDKIDSLINDIYLLRQKSIQEEGEFGIGNLVFKEFRNMGYLDHLKEVKRQLLSKDLSLESLEK